MRPCIWKNHVLFLMECISKPSSHLFTLLEHVDLITSGSKLQILLEVAIRLDDKSVS